MLRNVTIPTLTPFLPDPATRTGVSVVVVPGGALHFLAEISAGRRRRASLDRCLTMNTCLLARARSPSAPRPPPTSPTWSLS